MRSSAGHHSFDDRSVLGVRQAIGPDKGIAMFLVKCRQLQRIVHRAAEFKPTVKYWLRPDFDNRVAAGEITALMQTTVTGITPDWL